MTKIHPDDLNAVIFSFFRRTDVVMRENTVVENPQRDTAETQRRKPGERETDMQMDGKRIGIGEVIRKGIEEMRGTGRKEGKGTS